MSKFLIKCRGFYVLCKWSSPLILAYAYYRDYMNVDGLYSLCNFAYLFGMVLIGVYILRGFGRLSNPEYLEFIKKFAHFNQLDSAERKVFTLNSTLLSLFKREHLVDNY